MKFFEADDSGITYDPHPQSSRRPEDRVFYLMHKATVDCLAGSHLTLAAQSFQRALEKHMDAVPVGHEWVDYPDLFDFLRPLISHSTVEAMCGSDFVSRFSRLCRRLLAIQQQHAQVVTRQASMGDARSVACPR